MADGLFDDLVPKNKRQEGGLFDDLVPAATPDLGTVAVGPIQPIRDDEVIVPEGMAPDLAIDPSVDAFTRSLIGTGPIASSSTAPRVSQPGNLGDLAVRGVLAIPELAADLIDLPGNVAGAVARAAGVDPSRSVAGALLSRGTNYVTDAMREPATEADRYGYGAPSVTGAQAVEAVNPFANDARAAAAAAFGEPGNYDHLGVTDRLGTIGTLIAEQAIRSGPEMAAAVASLPAYIAGRTNAIAEQRAENDERADVSLGDLLIGGGAAAVEGTLERFTTGRLLPGGTPTLPPGVLPAAGRVARETAVQAPLGGVEELAAYAGENLGTERGATGQEALETFVTGLLAEGGLGAVAQTANEAVAAAGRRGSDPAPAAAAPPASPPPAAPLPSLGDLDAEDTGDLDTLLQQALTPELVDAARTALGDVPTESAPPAAAPPVGPVSPASPAAQSSPPQPDTPRAPESAEPAALSPEPRAPVPATPTPAQAGQAPAEQSAPVSAGADLAALGDLYAAPEGRSPMPAPEASPLDVREEIGWSQIGGRVIREADTGGLKPEVVGRTTWRGKNAPDGSESSFWRDRPIKWSEAEARTAMDKFERGEKLTRREQGFIDYAGRIATSYAEAEQRTLEELRAYEVADQQRAIAEIREATAIEIAEVDAAEALSVYELARRAAEAGVADFDAAPFAGESPRAYAARLWSLIDEAGRGTDTGATQQDRGSGDQGRESGPVGAAQDFTLGGPEPAATEAARAQAVAPASGGLFGAPTARDLVDGATRARDAQRNGATGTGRTDMAAGDGELFAGPRPAQARVDEAPSRSAPATRPAASGKRRGEVGMKFEPGETVVTASGRDTTPFPNVTLDTNRKASGTIKRVDKWLMTNAMNEAMARGDKFNARTFAANLERPSQSDKDSAEEYLFGDQPAVPRPFTRPLRGDAPLESVEDAPFYSAAVRAIEEGRGAPKRGNAQAWKGWLDGAVRRGDMKQSERDWLGIDAWLEGRESTTREELAEFVRANQVQVQDVTLGDSGQVWEYRGDGRFERGDVVLQQKRDGTVLANDPSGEVEFATIEEAKAHYRTSSVAEERPTKFSAYQLPGGENYRELLLTLPPKADAPKFDPAKVEVRRGGMSSTQRNVTLFYDGSKIGGPFDDSGSFSSGYRQQSDDHWMQTAKRIFNEGIRDPMGRTVAESVANRDAFRSSHFDQPNILAHVRFNERTDADGKRVLFLEEIQSDWHQAGRRSGYKAKLPDASKVAAANRSFNESAARGENAGDWRRANPEHAAVLNAGFAADQGAGRVPDAPFKATDEWAMLAFKRMVRHAAENGFDRIAWTTGEQQAERYDLSKQVERIHVDPNPDGTRWVGIQPGGPEVSLLVDANGVIESSNGAGRSFRGKNLAEVIGKEVADRIMSSGAATLQGDGLKFGGEGMRAFYDKILPAAVNKWAKRFGGRVGQVALGLSKSGQSYQQTLDAVGMTSDEWAALTPDDRRSRLARANAAQSVHAIDVTPAMRDAALGGQPLFRDELTDADLTPAERAAFERQSAAMRERDGDDELQAELARMSREQGAEDADRMGLRAAVEAAVGSSPVTYLRGYDGLPDRLRQGVERRNSMGRRGRTAGLYDPATGAVYLFTDVVSTPARAAFTAAHEIAGHHGLRRLLGDNLDRALELALQNPTVARLADEIASQRKLRPDQRMLAAEESLAELAAAVRTGDYGHIADRYGVEVPPGIRERVKAAIENFLRRLKALFDRKGVAFTDADVRELLENAWQAVGGEVESGSLEAMRPNPRDLSRMRRMGEDAYIREITDGRPPQDHAESFEFRGVSLPDGARKVAAGSGFDVMEKAGEDGLPSSFYAVDNGRVIGFISGGELESELIVDPSSRRRGIGAALQRAYRARDPFAASGGMTAAGERLARRLYREWTAPANDGLRDTTYAAPRGFVAEPIPAPTEGEAWYHGRPAGARDGFDAGRVAFLTRRRDGAEWFAQGGGRVTEHRVDVRNPARLRDLEDVLREQGYAIEDGPTDDRLAERIQASSPYAGENEIDAIYVPEIRSALEAKGFDGLLVSDTLENESHEIVVVWDAEKIDSANESTAQDQTETAAFRRWFGDSKVVDADGKPLVVYHGTNQSFDSFDEARNGQNTSAASSVAFFFTEDAREADEYAELAGRTQVADAVNVERKTKEYEKKIAAAERRGDWDEYERLTLEMEEMVYGGVNADPSGQAIVPVYLAIENPLALDMRGSFDAYEVREAIERAKNEGYDGLKLTNVYDPVGLGTRESSGLDTATQWVAFRPEQIKSATANRGTFDPSSPSILESVEDAQQRAEQRRNEAAGTLPVSRGTPGWNYDDGAWEGRKGQAKRARMNLQDKMIGWRDVQNQIASQVGAAIPDAQNVYRLENLMHGRVSEGIDRIEREQIEPLMDAMRKAGVTPEALEDYLYALHARERNDQIAKINPAMPDGGSGMTNEQAKRILAAADRAKLDPLAKRVAAITRANRRRLLQSGLITQDAFDAMEAQYEHYVPLRGRPDPDEATGGTGAGRGLDTRSKPVNQALGRKSRARNILGEVIGDAQRSVILAEKARVGRAVMRLVLANPNPELWTVEPVQTERALDAMGQVYDRVVNDWSDPSIVAVRHKGQVYRVQINQPELATALNNVGVDQLGAVTRAAAWVNRYFSAILTKYNPAFVPVNATRDALFGLTGLAVEHGEGVALEAAIGYLPAALAATKHAAGKGGSGQWDQWAREFAAAGGKTGYVAMPSVEELQRSVARVSMTGPVAKLTRAAKPIKDAVGVLNDGVENALRLSAYVTLRKRGMAADAAAEYAKNMTVNFNRKGVSGTKLNAWFLFYNAATQGAKRTGDLLRRPKTYAYLGALAAVQTIAAMAAMGMEDEEGEPLWNKIPDHVKRRNLVIVLPASGEYESTPTVITIPMPYGFNLFTYTAGRAVSEVVNRGRGDKSHTSSAAKITADVMSAATESFFPVPIGDGALGLLPTVLRIPVNVQTNRDDFGRQIRKDDPYAKSDMPRASMGRPDTLELFKLAATGLNRIGGGDELTPPPLSWFDRAPEDLEYLLKEVTGGAGKFVIDTATVGQKVTGGEFAQESTPKDRPILNRFVTNIDNEAAQQALFYDRREYVERGLKRVRIAFERDGEEAAEALLRSTPELKGAGFKRRKKTTDKGEAGDVILVDGKPQIVVTDEQAVYGRYKAAADVMTSRNDTVEEVFARVPAKLIPNDETRLRDAAIRTENRMRTAAQREFSEAWVRDVVGAAE